MTDEELKQLALDIRSGRVFGTWNVREGDERLIGSIFMVLMFMEQKDRDAMKEQGVVHLYEYLSQAGPRAINGYPMFMSMRPLTGEQAGKIDKIMAALAEAEKKALESI
jgi:hypothetical protein